MAPAPVVAPAPMHRRGLSPEEEARVRAALEQATGNTETGTPGTTMIPAVPPTTTPADIAAQEKAVADRAAAQQAMPASPAMGTTDLEARRKLREEMEAKQLAAEQAAMQQEQEARSARQAAEEKNQAEMAAKQPRVNGYPATSPAAPMGFSNPGATPPAMAMPMTLAPGSKEQRLQELLQLYKADRITPTEYHEQRAKIIAEP